MPSITQTTKPAARVCNMCGGTSCRDGTCDGTAKQQRKAAKAQAQQAEVVRTVLDLAARSDEIEAEEQEALLAATNPVTEPIEAATCVCPHCNGTGVIASKPIKAVRQPRTGSFGDLKTTFVRVLHALYNTTSQSASRRQIAEMCGFQVPTCSDRAIGPSNLAARQKLEQSKDGYGSPEKPYPTLLTRGWVEEQTIDVHGDGSVIEKVVSLTAEGREAYEEIATEGINLPPVKVRYASGG